VILDEAQNTTPEQMKMFLTRIGFGAKAVVTGDVSQIDLPRGAESGLIDAERVLRRVRGIATTHFTAADVVRHPLVARIVEAYDARGVKPTESSSGRRDLAAALRCSSPTRPTARCCPPQRARWSARRARAAGRDHGRDRRRRRGPRAEPRFRCKDYATNVLTIRLQREPAVVADLVLCASGAMRARRASGPDVLAHYAHLWCTAHCMPQGVRP
jgi:hypothetical protein